MKRNIGVLLALCACLLVSCAKKQGEQQGQAAAQPAAQPAATAAAPHAVVHLNDGGTVAGTIVASSATDVTVAGDNGIESKVPLQNVKSIDYGQAPAPAAAPVEPSARSPRTAAPAPRTAQNVPPPAPPQQAAPPLQAPAPAPAPVQAPEPAPAPPPPPPVVATTYELPAGSEISVRTNETIDSGTAQEGQTFSAQVTRDARDAGGSLVIPRGSSARIFIKSVSRGTRFRGASDLVLDLESVAINGQAYAVVTSSITQKGRSGIGANKRTAEFTGGAAALGAIIGAIAGGGKGAGIGVGAGAGAGALTQILTKGGAIRVPAETVLTFHLDQPLRVTAME